MRKTGGVVYSDFLSKDSVVLWDFAKEYGCFPDTVFNSFEGQTATYSLFNDWHFRHVIIKVHKQLGRFFYNEYLNSRIKFDSEIFNNLTKNYTRHLDPENCINGFKEVNISAFLIYVFSELSYMKLLGPDLSKNERLKEILDDIGTTNLAREKLDLFNIRLRIRQWKYNYKVKELSRIIDTEIQNLNRDESGLNQKNVISIIRALFEKSVEFDSFAFTIALYTILRSAVAIPSSRLKNILVDFSSNPILQNKLIREQRVVIKRYGKIISLQTLEKMKYLDAAIIESLLLSAPAQFLHRKVKKDVVLSNGVTIQKNSFVSMNLFEKYNQKVDEYGNRVYNIGKHMERKSPKVTWIFN
ncbi:hypothetical protein BB560_004306 [Smittium megazygosporum]|uniref:Cytochrome P450 n=1 Tax=Smittium megazygosporum TaxID=133381 RepID=A0A2T9Z9K5_9FUNG|nr:hypothetical protein BB560_004306 [Smittium megazygosporum]